MRTESKAVFVDSSEGDREHNNTSKVGSKQHLAARPKQALQLLGVHIVFRQQRQL